MKSTVKGFVLIASVYFRQREFTEKVSRRLSVKKGFEENLKVDSGCSIFGLRVFNDQ